MCPSWPDKDVQSALGFYSFLLSLSRCCRCPTKSARYLGALGWGFLTLLCFNLQTISTQVVFSIATMSAKVFKGTLFFVFETWSESTRARSCHLLHCWARMRRAFNPSNPRNAVCHDDPSLDPRTCTPRQDQWSKKVKIILGPAKWGSQFENSTFYMVQTRKLLSVQSPF